MKNYLTHTALCLFVATPAFVLLVCLFVKYCQWCFHLTDLFAKWIGIV